MAVFANIYLLGDDSDRPYERPEEDILNLNHVARDVEYEYKLILNI